MTETIERITVEGDDITVSLMVWRRFRRPMPGLVERVYDLNRDLADLGPFLAVGTVVEMPIPVASEIEVLDPVRLW